MIRASLFPMFFIALWYALLSAAPVAAQSHQTHQHSFGGAEQWAQEFDDPKRDAWQKPHEVIQALALKPDAGIRIGTSISSSDSIILIKRHDRLPSYPIS